MVTISKKSNDLNNTLNYKSALNQVFLVNYLKNAGYQLNLFLYKTLDSTQKEVKRQSINENSSIPLIIIANNQTSGYGRFKRKWYNTNKKSLCATFGFRPNKKAVNMQIFPIWASLHLCSYLKEKLGIKVKIKWPNDIVVDNKKIAGFITESTIKKNIMHHLFFGIGVNINNTNFPKDINNYTTSLKILNNNKTIKINIITAKILETILKSYQLFMHKFCVNNLLKMWNEFDFLMNKKITACNMQKTFNGIAQGINTLGQLQLKLDSGIIQLLNSESITLNNKNLL